MMDELETVEWPNILILEIGLVWTMRATSALNQLLLYCALRNAATLLRILALLKITMCNSGGMHHTIIS